MGEEQTVEVPIEHASEGLGETPFDGLRIVAHQPVRDKADFAVVTDQASAKAIAPSPTAM